MSAGSIFIIFSCLGLFIAIISVLWGSQQKILGATLLLGSIILSNIFFLLFGFIFPNIRDLTIVFILVDLALAGVYLTIFNDTEWLRNNRWAGGLVFVHLGMAGINFSGNFNARFGQSGTHALILNMLMITAFVICLISFTPKTQNEAWGVLRMKWQSFRGRYLLRHSSKIEVNLGRQVKDHDLYNEYLGGRIRELRKNSELNQEMFAKHLGVSTSQIKKLETGRMDISARLLFRIANFFNRDMNYFTEGMEALLEEKKEISSARKVMNK